MPATLTRRRQAVDKCTFCVHRLEPGQPPACVETCVGNSRHFGDLNDPNSEVSKLLATHQYVSSIREAGTEPAIYYIAAKEVIDCLSRTFPRQCRYANSPHDDPLEAC